MDYLQIVVLGGARFFTGLASQMLYPIMPLFLVIGRIASAVAGPFWSRPAAVWMLSFAVGATLALLATPLLVGSPSIARPLWA